MFATGRSKKKCRQLKVDCANQLSTLDSHFNFASFFFFSNLFKVDVGLKKLKKNYDQKAKKFSGDKIK